MVRGWRSRAGTSPLGIPWPGRPAATENASTTKRWRIAVIDSNGHRGIPRIPESRPRRRQPHPRGHMIRTVFPRLRRLVLTASLGISALLLACSSAPQRRERPNVLLICVDDLRPELACFGVPYVRSPNIDRLAAAGRAFRRHYVQAPTCGASPREPADGSLSRRRQRRTLPPRETAAAEARCRAAEPARVVPPRGLHDRVGRQGLAPPRRPRRQGLERRRAARDARFVGPAPVARRPMAASARLDARPRQRRDPRTRGRHGRAAGGRRPGLDLPRRHQRRPRASPNSTSSRQRTNRSSSPSASCGRTCRSARQRSTSRHTRTSSCQPSRTRTSPRARRRGTDPASS